MGNSSSHSFPFLGLKSSLRVGETVDGGRNTGRCHIRELCNVTPRCWACFALWRKAAPYSIPQCLSAWLRELISFWSQMWQQLNFCVCEQECMSQVSDSATAPTASIPCLVHLYFKGRQKPWDLIPEQRIQFPLWLSQCDSPEEWICSTVLSQSPGHRFASKFLIENISISSSNPCLYLPALDLGEGPFSHNLESLLAVSFEGAL